MFATKSIKNSVKGVISYGIVLTFSSLALAQTGQTSPTGQNNTVTSAPTLSPSPQFCSNGTVIIVDDVRECRIDDTLDKLIADFEQSEILGNPIAAGQEGDRAALRKLPNVTPEADAEFARITTDFIRRHAALSTRPMSTDKRLNYDLLGFVLTQRKRLMPFDQARIPFTNDSGFFNEMSYIMRQTSFASVDDYEAYAARLIEVVQKFGSSEVKAHSFYKPFLTFPDTISKEDQSRLTALGEAAINSSVLPAYRDLKAFLENEYAPQARQTVGIGSTAEGRELYRALVRYFTTLPVSYSSLRRLLG